MTRISVTITMAFQRVSPVGRGLASYSAQDAWVPYVSLTAKYPIGEHVVLMASAGYSELPEEITDSPMIDRNESFTFVTGVSWRF